MRIRVAPDPTSLAREAADAVAEVVRKRRDARIGLPTGATPIPTYAELNERTARSALDLSGVSVYALDEFAGVPREARGTNSAFYREHLRFRPRALHVPNPAARDPDEHIRAYADAIRRAEGLDLCLLGIGTNGHVAFNEPGSGRDSTARAVELTAATREAHAESFGGLDRVPRRGMTLGVADLLESRRIVVLATGGHKAAIVRRAIEGAPGPDAPASWLREHRDVTWLLDDGAASGLEQAVRRA